MLSALGIESPNDSYDTVIMGWNTFAVGLSQGIDSPYPHLRQYVASRSHDASEVGSDVEVVATDPIGMVRQLKAESSAKGIWLCGGGALAGELREEIDRLVLKVNPVLLGSGVRLFRSVSSRSRQFILESNRAFDSGVLMATYQAVRN